MVRTLKSQSNNLSNQPVTLQLLVRKVLWIDVECIAIIGTFWYHLMFAYLFTVPTKSDSRFVSFQNESIQIDKFPFYLLFELCTECMMCFVFLFFWTTQRKVLDPFLKSQVIICDDLFGCSSSDIRFIRGTLWVYLENFKNDGVVTTFSFTVPRQFGTNAAWCWPEALL